MRGVIFITTYYVSPSSFSYRQYRELNRDVDDFGWKCTWLWPHSCFHNDAFIDHELVTKALKGIARTDIFIAAVPGTASTNIEIGAAFFKCEELFLVTRDFVHFRQTGLCDAYLGTLPGIKRTCCEIKEIPKMLKREYPQLINQRNAAGQ